MNILDKIISRKREELLIAKQQVTIDDLMRRPLFDRTCYNLRDSVLDPQRTGIIAEYKRASPSKGVINDQVTVEEVTRGYAEAGASAISVLTDRDFFKGSLQDLIKARETVNVPLLRKDFIIDEYQIAEAKAYGADIILLIAAVLNNEEVESLAKYAKNLGLNVLLEVHNQQELETNLFDTVDAIGVNNRNLKDFTVSIDHSLALVNRIPESFVKVSESGISDPLVIKQLKKAGFQAFLIGENFMKTTDPSASIKQFVNEL
ncbi:MULTISPECIES: indole-3-glycerol phosphate synthase TrpC [Olivibacter]|jgi:indole-3-glycerol phosphate synthase|uniref:Indole-3-glycerol phosphate synthase n=2 Tax=Olivibacter TaxID=376469 RepID=A0ABV6HFH1_9SPHI|nr:MULTISPECIES: indole-3-glycerol phosphate synthase TrpC [Olivibacter]MCL4638790.1 indole-3-glycerol phosphate synthase TrpC [Olivibacter sp. UJ_SKK_5.1]MDM8177645.1 indole-3-glycerol phosphate synthase TrpC [Olivibacter sp. 47]MDX3912364.1 indole-3-glycerol phosphate synthase TrpC [Pseudosphingobacterium sp.]QEL00086.1 indole-3-glycerol phosphate synthase TrpC [Olivibacter sp. LS-1]